MALQRKMANFSTNMNGSASSLFPFARHSGNWKLGGIEERTRNVICFLPDRVCGYSPIPVCLKTETRNRALENQRLAGKEAKVETPEIGMLELTAL